MTLGGNIKRIRKIRGIKQSDLANKLEVTVRTIQNYESGNREPNMETLKKISTTLGVSVDALTVNESFENEILSRAIHIALDMNPDSNDIFMILGHYADYDTLLSFYNKNISFLPPSDTKGLLQFIAENSPNEYNRIYNDLIETEIYDLDDTLKNYCFEIFSKSINVLDYMSNDNIDFLKSMGMIKDGHLIGSIELNESDHSIKKIKRNNTTVLLPSSFEEVKDTVNKTFPTLEPMIQLLTNPKIEIAYNYSYNDLAACGYEELLFTAIEKTIKTTLSEIKEHEEKGDLFDGLGSWISKESPVYDMLKKSQENNKKVMDELTGKSVEKEGE